MTELLTHVKYCNYLQNNSMKNKILLAYSVRRPVYVGYLLLIEIL